MPTPFCAEDLRLYRANSSLDCAHDGLGVCAVHSIDAGSGDTLTNLWLVRTDGTAPQQFTQGDVDDAPRWSSDGASVAFLATRLPFNWTARPRGPIPRCICMSWTCNVKTPYS